MTFKATKQTDKNIPYINFVKKQDYKNYISGFFDGEELIVEIFSKRTLPQNKLLHLCLRIISNYIGETFEYTKAWIVIKFFGFNEIEIDGKKYTVPISTSELSKEDMRNGLTNLYQWAEEQNIHLPIIY